MKLTKHQQGVYDKTISAVRKIMKMSFGGKLKPLERMISIHGPAGVGKTFVTSKIIKTLHKDYNLRITTPTHKSLNVVNDMISNLNLEISSSTIHSFLNLKLKPDYTSGQMKLFPEGGEKDKSKLDILIIDESSMLSQEIFDFICDSIKSYRVKCVIFVGDELQLSAPDSDEFEVPYNVVKYRYELKEVVRQAYDNPILHLVTDIRFHLESKDFIDPIEFFKPASNIEIFDDPKEFVFDAIDNDDSIILAFTNDKVNKYNYIIRKTILTREGKDYNQYILPGETLVLQGAYEFKNKGKGRTKLRIPGFKNGESVVVNSCVLKTDEELGIQYWRCYTEDDRVLEVVDKNSEKEFERTLAGIAKLAKTTKNFHQRTETWKLFFSYRERYVNIKHKYSHTIHKSQGSTYKVVYFDARELRSANYMEPEMLYRLMYVGLSRATDKLCILI